MIAQRFILYILPLLLHAPSGLSFVPLHSAETRSHVRFSSPTIWTTLRSTVSNVESMRAGEIKQELESYGISTKSFLEKKELVEALNDARAKGLKPREKAASVASPASTTSAASSTSASSSDPSPSATKPPREEQIKEEMIKCQSMKVVELKKELAERGVSTRSLFEKSELVQALADARVDGTTRKASASSSSSRSSAEDGYAEYKNVEVVTDNSAGPRPKQSEVSQQSTGSDPRSGGGNPFGGGGEGGSPFGGGSSVGNPFTGMGGMGGIADMLKNLGGGGGSSPFGGGGNPFSGGGGGMGDVMGRAQEMMKNPKVQQLMAKAQGNPEIMRKMQECMSNPAAFAKYQNDPDVAELIREIRNFM